MLSDSVGVQLEILNNLILIFYHLDLAGSSKTSKMFWSSSIDATDHAPQSWLSLIFYVPHE